MRSLIIPENALFETIRLILNILQKDIRDAPLGRQILTRLFGNDLDSGQAVQFSTYNYYQQAKALFERTAEHPAVIGLSQGFNLERAASPHIHILLPGEDMMPSMGLGQGYQPDILEETDEIREVYHFTVKANYNVMITSPSASEVILIYHVIRAMLYSLSVHLDALGVRDMKFSGQDLTMGPSSLPENLFYRNLIISVMYEVEIPALTADNLPTSIDFSYVQIDPDRKQVGDVELPT